MTDSQDPAPDPSKFEDRLRQRLRTAADGAPELNPATLGLAARDASAQEHDAGAAAPNHTGARGPRTRRRTAASGLVAVAAASVLVALASTTVLDQSQTDPPTAQPPATATATTDSPSNGLPEAIENGTPLPQTCLDSLTFGEGDYVRVRRADDVTSDDAALLAEPLGRGRLTPCPDTDIAITADPGEVVTIRVTVFAVEGASPRRIVGLQGRSGEVVEFRRLRS